MFDPIYYLFAIPALILGLYAQYRVRSAYARFSRVGNTSGIVGYEAARRLLAISGLEQVTLQEKPGHLSDHYDPRSKTLALSSGVARSASVASLGIVAHEVGHAIQDHREYLPLELRSGLVPVVRIGSWLGPIIFLGGMVLPIPNMSLIGLLFFSATLVFSLVTLPVEFDASRRAVSMLQQSGMMSGVDERGVQQVLSAASLTYVAAATQALSTILYYVFLLGGYRRRD
jgi:Zn-dependent membrane protease YugP